MKTHVIYENGLYAENYSPTIEIMPKDFNYGNFKGTKIECEIERENMILKHNEMMSEKFGYVKPNYSRLQDVYADELTLQGR
tara:strand:- start:124 stop:369 length:246 start_codon:yes stop_codon:yes gene_type:complete